MSERVTVLVRNPNFKWADDVDMVEVYESRDEAEDRQQELGAQMDPASVIVECCRLIDGPFITEGNDG